VAPQLNRVGDLTVGVERPTTPSSRPPVLLIHGMFGGAWYWEPYQSLLAGRGYESYALNLRGHHGSRPVSDIGTVRLRDYVDDALEVARTLRNPIVIGHSMGGLIAQKVAEAGACRAAVFMSAAPPRWIPAMGAVLGRTMIKPRYLKGLLLHRPLLPTRSDADALMFNRTPLEDRGRFFARLVPESGRAGFELAFGVETVQASRVTAPVLVVTGLDDQFVVPRVARALARKYHAPLRAYESFAHHIMSEPGWERPAADVVAWLDGVAGSTRG
jgi:hypothetical protein